MNRAGHEPAWKTVRASLDAWSSNLPLSVRLLELSMMTHDIIPKDDDTEDTLDIVEVLDDEFDDLDDPWSDEFDDLTGDEPSLDPEDLDEFWGDEDDDPMDVEDLGDV